MFAILKLSIWLKDLLFYDFYNNSKLMFKFILSPLEFQVNFTFDHNNSISPGLRKQKKKIPP